jgi:hypothetical protein
LERLALTTKGPHLHFFEVSRYSKNAGVWNLRNNVRDNRYCIVSIITSHNANIFHISPYVANQLFEGDQHIGYKPKRSEKAEMPVKGRENKRKMIQKHSLNKYMA